MAMRRGNENSNPRVKTRNTTPKSASSCVVSLFSANESACGPSSMPTARYPTIAGSLSLRAPATTHTEAASRIRIWSSGSWRILASRRKATPVSIAREVLPLLLRDCLAQLHGVAPRFLFVAALLLEVRKRLQDRGVRGMRRDRLGKNGKRLRTVAEGIERDGVHVCEACARRIELGRQRKLRERRVALLLADEREAERMMQ